MSEQQAREAPEYRDWLASQLAEHPTWKNPPGIDDRLHWRFCNADAELGFASGFGAIEALGLSGVTVRGLATGDGKLVGRRTVGLKNELNDSGGSQEAPAEKLRNIDEHLMKLSAEHRLVLWLAYGPENYHAQVKQKLGGESCGVALVSPVAKAAHLASKSELMLGAWLTQVAGDVVVARVKTDIRKLVFVAWNLYADSRGRLRRTERRTAEELEALK